MRIAVWALVSLASLACSRRSLQADGGGTGSIAPDGAGGAVPTDGGLGAIDGPPQTIDTQPPSIDAWSAPADGGRSCGVSTIAGNRVPTEILLLLDRSIAGDPTGWYNLMSEVMDQITASGDRFEWGLYTFPKDGPACGAATVTAGADLEFGSGVTWHLLAHVVEAGVDGNGTPTAAAIAAGSAYLSTVMDQSPKLMMLVTDGPPTCPATLGVPLPGDATMAQADAVAAITTAQTEGFSTVVVAPATTTAVGDVGALNALAQAGGYARQGDIKFFTESTLAELFAPAGTTSCSFPLSSPPPVPDGVGVTLNGDSVPRDTRHISGWDYSDMTRTSFTLYGAWCSMVMDRRSFEIRVTYDCPIFPVP
jgi:hypothetical protein